MFFRSFRNDSAFQRALRAAVASHRPIVVRTLLASHGAQVFANALSDLSGRVIADALSMLSASDGNRISSRLPRTALQRMREAAPDGEGLRTHLNSPSWSMLLAR